MFDPPPTPRRTYAHSHHVHAPGHTRPSPPGANAMDLESPKPGARARLPAAKVQRWRYVADDRGRIPVGPHPHGDQCRLQVRAAVRTLRAKRLLELDDR